MRTWRALFQSWITFALPLCNNRLRGGATFGADFHLQWLSMANYRIYRMKDSPRQHFRWAPHVSGPAVVKPKDYEPTGQIEAANEYEAWRRLRDSATPLEVGDLLELDQGDLRICKYVGFETAQWALPEIKTVPPPELDAAAPQNGA